MIHKDLRERWGSFSLAEQMGNIGAETARFLSHLDRGDEDRAEKSFERAVELLDWTIANSRDKAPNRELLRLREVLSDKQAGSGEYEIDSRQINNYFLPFAIRARAR